MFIAARVTLRAQVSPATGIVLRFLYTPMRAVIADRPGVEGWALKATSIRGTRQLMVNHFVLFFFFWKPCVALRIHSQSSSLRDKTSQHHLAIKVQSKVVKNTTSLLSVIVLLIERHVSAYSEAIIRFNYYISKGDEISTTNRSIL
jgi:hypothetical protein